MAKEEKSILEQAAMDAQKIQEALNANTKEILRSVAIEEIDSVLKESLEEGYVEEDVDDTDELEDADGEETGDDFTGGEEVATDDAGEVDTNSSIEGGDEFGGDIEGDYETGMDAEASGDELEMDMTGASDDEVIAIYKKLTDDDEIEVVVDDATGDVKLTVNQPGEFVIKTEAQPVAPEGEFGDEFGGEMGPEMGAESGDEFGAEAGVEPSGEEFDLEGGAEEEGDDFTSSDELPSEDGDEKEKEEEVMYEITLDENELFDSKLNKDSKIGATASGKPRTATSDVNKSMNGTLPTGDIEGTKATSDTEINGDNLTGGFTEKTNGSGDLHADYVMNEDELSEEEIEAEGEEVSEKIQVGKARTVANNKTTIQGAGGDANKVKAPNVTAPNMSEMIKKYNTLLKEANELKVKNGEYKQALGKFRTMLAETVVFNSNLTYVAKLFMEHSTTRQEKEGIFERFDNEVSTILESKKLFKAIDSELGSRKPINESINTKLNNEVASSSSKQLNETTAYVDKETSRIMDLMKRVDNR